jgi:phosphoribosylformimino-5-aminoimidazole carboxamide ribotide isomerase
MLFLPAIDLIDGSCVRLLQGCYEKKTMYDQDPVATAMSFEDQGAQFLHIVDLDAARGDQTGNEKVIQKIAKSITIPVEVGGGVRDRQKIRLLLDLGVSRVIIGTLLVRDESRTKELVDEFKEKLVAGIDAKKGVIMVSGWTQEGGLPAAEVGKRARDMGFSLIIYTDISKDGMLAGPNLLEVKTMAVETGVPVIASGGIADIGDIKKVKTLEMYGVSGVIAGKAIYEGRLSVREACKVLQEI